MIKRRNRNLTPIIIFVVILMPLIIVGILYMGEPTYKKLPIYGNKIANTPGDTTYHTIAPFTLVNAQGDSFSRSRLDGKIYVTNFIFTRCPGLCPKLTQAMKEVQEEYPKLPDLAFLSISVDPKNDSPAVLRQYKQKNNITADNWHFLTGDKQEVYQIGKQEYLVAIAEGDTTSTNLEEQFLHTEFLVLVDKDQRVRGFYRGTSTEDIKTLKEEIRVLYKEYEVK